MESRSSEENSLPGPNYQAEALAQIDAMAEPSTDAVVCLDASLNILRWNAAAERLYGRPAPDALGQDFGLVLQAGRRVELEQALERVRSGAHAERYETVHLATDGRELPVEVTALPIKTPDGTVQWFGLIVRDTSRQKRTEEAQQFLAEASTLLSSSLDYDITLGRIARLAVPRLADLCVIYNLEADGSICRLALEHADPEAKARADAEPDEFIRDPALTVGVPEVLRTARPVLDRHLLISQLQLAVYDAGRLRGYITRLNLQSWVCVPLAVHGRTFGAISFLSTTPGRYFDEGDLLVDQEFALRAALALDNARLYREAQEAILVRDQFLSVASHELKTPLTSLLGYSELLEKRHREGEALAEQDLRALRAIFKQGERLNKLVLALLDISRIENGKLSIDQVEVDLAALVCRVVDEERPGLRKHTIDLRVAAAPLPILGDELRLEQVLYNLVQNAVKYSPDGGTIRVDIWREGNLAKTSIADPGIGIPAADLPQLFTRFYRAANAVDLHISGMGLGLYIIREIMHLHGGEIDVQSEPGHGSTFTLTLPLLTDSAR